LGFNHILFKRALAAKNLAEAQKGPGLFGAFLKLLVTLFCCVPGNCRSSAVHDFKNRPDESLSSLK